LTRRRSETRRAAGRASPTACEGSGTHQLARRLLHLAYLGIIEPANRLWKGPQDLSLEGIGALEMAWHLGDLGSHEPVRWRGDVRFHVGDLPSAADDPACGEIHPRRRASDLDLLSAREPEAPLDQAVLEDDRDILELGIPEGSDA